MCVYDTCNRPNINTERHLTWIKTVIFASPPPRVIGELILRQGKSVFVEYCLCLNITGNSELFSEYNVYTDIIYVTIPKILFWFLTDFNIIVKYFNTFISVTSSHRNYGSRGVLMGVSPDGGLGSPRWRSFQILPYLLL